MLLAGTLLSVLLLFSSFSPSALSVVILPPLHLFAVPFLLVFFFPSLTLPFEVLFSSRVYFFFFFFFPQLSFLFMSVLAFLLLK
ncbi:MFS transporter, partial [Escherichia coli]|uniref:MFS transporter n=1 Tax=Escherichia coli TaxID=562 RepID=UPI00338EF76D